MPNELVDPRSNLPAAEEKPAINDAAAIRDRLEARK